MAGIDFDRMMGKGVQTVAGLSGDLFEWELPDDLIADQLKTYGFVYKCLIDNTSNPAEWMSFDTAWSRNAIPAILNCHESHLLSGILTLAYPEQGLSPKDCARFVHNVTMHPQANKIKELRLITRSPWFVSDAKNYNVRIIQIDNAPSNVEDTIFHIPAVGKHHKKKDRLKITRPDPYFIKNKKHALFFNLVDNKADTNSNTGIYLGEDHTFVYWRDVFRFNKILRTPHKEMWYDLNTIMLNNEQCDPLLPMISAGASHEDMRESLRMYEDK